ncbi:MAG TPA: c-type cytochrome [Caldimonas sp.]|jgi:cytochrome c553|nr:c-type cytochrome [Caldimonas sp.]HEX2541164.1 c-type cytochrome [Caldimonas sp.]
MKKPPASTTPTALRQAFAEATAWLALACGVAVGGAALAQGTAARPADVAGSAPAPAATSTPAQAAPAAPTAAQGPRPGDPAAGATKIASCIGCHNISGYQASFPEIYKVPKIAGQTAGYIVAALAGYRKGERKHPTMRAIATTLSDQDMADIAAYYEQLGKQGAQPVPAKPAREPSPQVAKLLAQANCASCHGANYAAPIDPTYPKLAGQYADYLYVALKAYQTDNNRYSGRNNAIMMGMARPFTHAELKAMSKYLAELPSELKTVQQTQFR